MFLPLVIDFYGIVVALPAIGRDLHSSTTSLAWTAAAAEVEQIVRASFDHGCQARMILCAVLSLAGVAVALIGTGTRPALVPDRPPRAA